MAVFVRSSLVGGVVVWSMVALCIGSCAAKRRSNLDTVAAPTVEAGAAQDDECGACNFKAPGSPYEPPPPPPPTCTPEEIAAEVPDTNDDIYGHDGCRPTPARFVVLGDSIADCVGVTTALEEGCAAYLISDDVRRTADRSWCSKGTPRRVRALRTSLGKPGRLPVAQAPSSCGFMRLVMIF